MHSLQPQALTNAELERLAYIVGYDQLPTKWVSEILSRTEKDWKTKPEQNPDQLALDLS